MEGLRFKMIYMKKINNKLKEKRIFNNEIRILGDEFVKNNKNKAKLIINNKKYKLKEHINNNNINTKELTVDKLKVGMLLYNGLSNISHIFENCTKLLEFLYYGDIFGIDDDVSNLEDSNNNDFYFDYDYNFDYDNNNISQNSLYRNIRCEDIYPNLAEERMEEKKCDDCGSIISYIRDKIIFFKTKNNYFFNMSHMFYNCSSLLSLPDILEWNTDFVIDMSSMFYNCSSLS